jgi:acyl transferase domain-containing protein
VTFRKLEPMSPDLAAEDGKWVTSISSFGVGGSNAHIVVESFDSTFQKPSDVIPASQPPLYLFMAASFTESSLSRVQASIVEAFHGLTDDTLLRSLARDLARQSRSYHYTSFAVASSLSSTLSFSKPTSTNAIHEEKKLCLVFAGQGPQHVAMGRELAAIYPEFWKSILMSNGILVQRFGKEGLLERTALFVPGKTASLPSNGVWPVADVIYSIVFFQIAIVDLIMSLGISYGFVIGHR